MKQDFKFDLPSELIAQQPPAHRGDSRLLRVVPGRGVTGEAVFRELPGLLRRGDRLVLNDSRVLPARLLTRREDTGGQVEILLLRPVADARWPGGWVCLARPARRLRPGIRLAVEPPPGGPVAEPPVLTVLHKREVGAEGQVIVGAEADLAALAEQWGVMPLPPYIQRTDVTRDEDGRDRERYQTVYATADASGAGSVAAPTAGLHFSTATLAALEEAGIGLSRVSLHVGPGTFKPPTDDQIAAKRLHREFFRMSTRVSRELADTRRAGGRVIAVGTTALRVLESVARLDLADRDGDSCAFGPTDADPDPWFTGAAARRDGHWEVQGETRLFISPPDTVTAVDGLLTNFHLPGSSLLMLVAALIGPAVWPAVYRHAVEQRLRFYSYGDCMLILPNQDRSAQPGTESEAP